MMSLTGALGPPTSFAALMSSSGNLVLGGPIEVTLIVWGTIR
jgi:hypothetical protein